MFKKLHLHTAFRRLIRRKQQLFRKYNGILMFTMLSPSDKYHLLKYLSGSMSQFFCLYESMFAFSLCFSSSHNGLQLVGMLNQEHSHTPRVCFELLQDNLPRVLVLLFYPNLNDMFTSCMVTVGNNFTFTVIPPELEGILSFF